MIDLLAVYGLYVLFLYSVFLARSCYKFMPYVLCMK